MRKMVVFFILAVFIFSALSVSSGVRDEKEFSLIIKEGKHMLELMEEAISDLENTTALLILAVPLDENSKMVLKDKIIRIRKIINENRRLLKEAQTADISDAEILDKLKQIGDNSRLAVILQEAANHEIKRIVKEIEKRNRQEEKGI